MNPGVAILWMTFVVAGGLAAFHYLSDILFVKIIGALAIILFLISLWRMNKVMVLNRVAFKSLEFSMTPMLNQRKLLALFRLHAESAEDQFFSAVNSYLTLIVMLSLTIEPWWLCVAALLHSFGNYYALRRSWPGYALILGASNKEGTKRLTILVQRCVSPLFTTNLLNFVSTSEIEDELFTATSYRLKNEVISWKAAVEVHSVFARVIILDVSYISEGVREEIELMVDCDFWYKMIILCPTEQSYASVSALLSTRPDTLVVEKQEQVKSTLEELLKHFPDYPTSERCLKKLVVSCQ
ncbi:hypothetical protein ACIL2W_004519 [Vibrio parahaemolyticus]|nr:hypothetical protein [Vibrio parahaemolyticus]